MKPVESATSTGEECRAEQPGFGSTTAFVSTQIVGNSSLSLAERLVASAAAASLIEQHHVYNLEGLCDYLTEHFPGVPAEARQYLVIGAAAGAQHAAQIHYLVDAHRLSHEQDKKEVARNARCSLSNWALGLRSQPSGSVSQRDQSFLLELELQELSTVPDMIPSDTTPATLPAAKSVNETDNTSSTGVNSSLAPGSLLNVQRFIEDLERNVGLCVVETSLSANVHSEVSMPIVSETDIQSFVFPEESTRPTESTGILPEFSPDGEGSHVKDSTCNQQNCIDPSTQPIFRHVTVEIPELDRQIADAWSSQSRSAPSDGREKTSQDPSATSALVSLCVASTADSATTALRSDSLEQTENLVTPVTAIIEDAHQISEKDANRETTQGDSPVSKKPTKRPRVVSSSEEEVQQLVIDLSAPNIDDEVVQGGQRDVATPTVDEVRCSSPKAQKSTAVPSKTAPRSVVSKPPSTRTPLNRRQGEGPRQEKMKEKENRPRSMERQSVIPAPRRDAQSVQRQHHSQTFRGDRSRSPRRQEARQDGQQCRVSEKEYLEFQRWKRSARKD